MILAIGKSNLGNSACYPEAPSLLLGAYGYYFNLASHPIYTQKCRLHRKDRHVEYAIGCFRHQIHA